MSIFYLTMAILFAIANQITTDRYMRKHNVPREHILPFWPTITYALGSICLAHCFEIWLP